MKKISAVSLFLILLFSLIANAQDDPLLTWYEKSGETETPSYEETVRYCRLLADHSPWIHMASFGSSLQGRALPLLILSKDNSFRPEGKNSTKAVLMVQACIHPGEPEGKDAGLMLIRDIVTTKKLEHLLDNVTLLFIPIFNVDGHERFGPNNRINQNGPKEMGWRVTANKLNLNRDYLKADAPEMQAWIRLFNTWLPDFFIDCHTSDGADYQYVMTYALETYGNMEADLTEWQKSVYLPYIEQKMEARGFPIHPYVSFRNWFDPESGIRSSASPPMLSQGYTASRNRPGLLLETHMLKPYKPRVESTYEMILHSLEILNVENIRLKEMIRQADEYTASAAFRAKDFVIDWGIDYTDSSWIAFKGIAYEKTKSDLTGGDWYQYNGGPETLRLKLFNKPKAEASIHLPEAYIIPVEWKEVIERLVLHNVQMYRIDKAIRLKTETYRFRDYRWDRTPYEGRFRMHLTADPFEIERSYPAGSVIVPMDQSTAKIIAWALEPEANGSFVKWGFFNTIFEQKEYGETYVMEKMARELIEENPVLLEEFNTRKAEDEEFAKSQWLQLNWFYSKTPYWDDQKDIYPVGRILDRAIVDTLISNEQ